MAGKAASGAGSIRKKTVTRKGKQYTYWEARYSAGYDPGTGKQIQRSITGPTQKDVAQRLKAVIASIDAGTYTAPCRLTVGEWLDIWAKDYLGGVKPGTVDNYRMQIRRHIKPALGGVKLTDLRPHAIQGFINDMGTAGLSPASARLAYGVLRQALERAVDLDYLPKNPAARCTLPRMERAEIKPLEDAQVIDLLKAAQGGEIEQLVTVALFTGLRMSELLGLTWEAVDFEDGTITVDKQLTRQIHRAKSGLFASPKNGKPRSLAPAPSVMAALKRQWARQAEQRLRAGELWSNDPGLVFTDDLGRPLVQSIVDHRFTKLCKSAGIEGARFHDLRHTYAVSAIRAGDDIKTVQGSLGHASAGFTLDRYGHFTEQMKRDSAQRMEQHITQVLSS